MLAAKSGSHVGEVGQAMPLSEAVSPSVPLEAGGDDLSRLAPFLYFCYLVYEYTGSVDNSSIFSSVLFF